MNVNQIKSKYPLNFQPKPTKFHAAINKFPSINATPAKTPYEAKLKWTRKKTKLGYWSYRLTFDESLTLLCATKKAHTHAPQPTNDDSRHTNKINGDSSRSRFHELFCARTRYIFIRDVNFISKSVYLDHSLRFKDAATNVCPRIFIVHFE